MEGRGMTAADENAFRRSLLESYGTHFGHREHLHMCWSYVRRDGPAGGADRVVAFIKHLVAEHGGGEKYNETMTRFWVQVLAMADASHRSATFDDLLIAAPHLTDKELPHRHWSRELLDSPAAKARWVEPDLRALPVPAV
jgi:hypothetical protein